MTPDVCAPGSAAAQRSRLYWLLAGLLIAPNDPQARAALRERVSRSDEDSASDPALRELAAALESVMPTELAVEHTRLFGGLGPSYGPPPPLESALSGDGPEALLAVRRAYREAGYADIDPALPDDHLAVELKFMALLALREHEAAREGDDDGLRKARDRQRHFLERHLGAWLPGYARSIEQEARISALALTIALIDGVVARDREWLADAGS